MPYHSELLWMDEESFLVKYNRSYFLRKVPHQIKEHMPRKPSESSDLRSNSNQNLLPFVDLTNGHPQYVNTILKEAFSMHIIKYFYDFYRQPKIYKAITLKRTPITSQIIALKNEDNLKKKSPNLNDKSPLISTDKIKIEKRNSIKYDGKRTF